MRLLALALNCALFAAVALLSSQSETASIFVAAHRQMQDVYINDQGEVEEQATVVLSAKERAAQQAIYPEIISQENIRNGASILLLLGKSAVLTI